MKTLKFDHAAAQDILDGKKIATWRLYDDKDLSVNDEFKIIDKVESSRADTWRVIGLGKIYKIVEKALGDVTAEDMKGHQEFDSKKSILVTYKGYYGDRVSLETPVKMVYFNFIPSTEEVLPPEMLLDEAKIYTDGGSRGNPGHSACAYVIYDHEDQVVEKAGFYLGIATNNQAEYYGIEKALRRAQELGIDKVSLFSDSQLVVNQMNGLYKVKNQELAPLNHEVKKLADSFRNVSFTHVPREKNKIADSEVNRILDDHENGII